MLHDVWRPDGHNSTLGLVLAVALLGSACGSEPEPPAVTVTPAELLSAADCPAGYNVIEGTNGGDTLVGTAGDDCILGYGGNDTIFGGGGDDYIAAGKGHDEVHGGPGRDVIDGDQGNDTIFGDEDDDFLIGGSGGSQTVDGGPGNDACNGTSCELPEPVPSGCASDGDCATGEICVALLGLCIPCPDADADGTCDADDACPTDATKTDPGQCGCGVADTDSDSDGTADCNDGCPADAGKTAPGVCGCGVADTDSDSDGTADCNDGCPADAGKVDPGVCGCGVADDDSDGDGTLDCLDACSADPNKTDPGVCGCGVPEYTGDWDGDGVIDCFDTCYGYDDTADADADGTPDECDVCPGADDNLDADANGVPDGCEDGSGNWIGACTDGAVGANVAQGYFNIHSQSDLTPLVGKRCINGNLSIYAGVTDLSPLASLQGVSGSLYISGSGLTDLGGLELLEYVGYHLTIQQNTQLANVDALGSLGKVRQNLEITGNPVLTDLDGLSALHTVGAWLNVLGNVELVSLQGLLNVTSLGALYFYGDGGFSLRNNFALPGCWVGMLEQHFGITCGDVGYECYGNTGTGSCGTLPPDFECVPGAVGPGVHDGDLYVNPTSGVDLAEYGGLTCVTGDLWIDNSTLTDLTQLSTLQAVGGNLRISGNASLTSLDGLGALASVGGGLDLSYNPLLADTSGLSALTSLGASGTSPDPLYVFDNAMLSWCWLGMLEAQTGVSCGYQDWQGLWVSCSGNTGGTSCGALPPGFQCVPGASGPGVLDASLYVNPATPVDLAEYGGLTCVTGDLWIEESALTDLTGLSALQAVGGTLRIQMNASLASVDGLESLESIGRSLEIVSNDVLANLSGLSALTDLGASATWGPLLIFDNPLLSWCWTAAIAAQTGQTCGYEDGQGLWVDCSGNTGSTSCGALPPDFDCVPGAVGPGVLDDSLYINPWGLSPVDPAEYGGLTCVTGDLWIEESDLTDLTGLSALQAVGGTLRIQMNASLASVDGLENLASIGGSLEVGNNDALPDLRGLWGLTDLGAVATWDPLLIFDNAMLTPCWIDGLEQRTGYSCGYQDWQGQWVPCSGNAGTGSCELLPAGFSCEPGASGPGVRDGDLIIAPWAPPVAPNEYAAIACITGTVWIDDSSLTDLTGLSWLQAIGGDLRMEQNASLTSVDGLESLQQIRGHLTIGENPVLADLAGLSALTDLGANTVDPLLVYANAALPACWVEVIETQTGETCGYYNVTIALCTGNFGTGSCP